MIIAVDKFGKAINLFEELPEKENEFYCPACHSPVYLKNGPVKMAHFAHASLKNCKAWSENESAQHLGLKKELYDWFAKSEQVKLEVYLPELQQTPDLLVNEKIAIEIQCSSLSLQRLAERTKNYHKHGYKVIWLMGKDLWLKKSLTELQKNLLYFSENRAFFYWELDLENKKIRIKFLIHQNLRGKLIHLTEEFSFGQSNLLDFLRKPYLAQKLLQLEAEVDPLLEGYIRKQLYHSVHKWRERQKKYYQAGQNLMEMDYNKSYYAPPGLDLLRLPDEKQKSIHFSQITRDLSDYYQDYYQHFMENKIEKLYPPRFYAIMKNKGDNKNGKKT